MEERVGKVEGRVDRLEYWRNETADPWITESGEFHLKMDRFLATYEAQEKAAREAQAQRHQENTDKLNHMNTLMTVGILLVGIFGLILSAAGIAMAVLSAHRQGLLTVPFHTTIPASISINGGRQ